MPFAGSINIQNNKKDCVPLQAHGRFVKINRKLLFTTPLINALERVSSCTAQSGSISVEASLVTPIFMFIIVAIMYFIIIFGFQLKMQYCIRNVSNDINSKIYAVSQTQMKNSISQNINISEKVGSIVTAAKVHKYIVDDFGRENINKSYIVNGEYGLNLQGTTYDIEDSLLKIKVLYKIKIPYISQSILTIVCHQGYESRCWLGRSLCDEGTHTIVYITTTGSVYHASKECTYLKLSIKETTFGQVLQKRNTNGGKYYACELCTDAAPELTSNTLLYITDNGDRYHMNINCSGLKRGIISIDISDVGTRKPCSRCMAD